MIQFPVHRLSCNRHKFVFCPCGTPGNGVDELPHQKHGELLTQLAQLTAKPPPEVRKVCELGYCRGGSLFIWAEVWKGCTVLGIDVDGSQVVRPVFDHQDGCVPGTMRMMEGKLPEPESIEKIVAFGPFDVIVDDAGHGSFTTPTLLALAARKAVASGGLYIIEDLQAHPDFLKAELLAAAGSLGEITVLQDVISIRFK
jgi:hypothetical protein